jgi:hypothetical protein
MRRATQQATKVSRYEVEWKIQPDNPFPNRLSPVSLDGPIPRTFQFIAVEPVSTRSSRSTPPVAPSVEGPTTPQEANAPSGLLHKGLADGPTAEATGPPAVRCSSPYRPLAAHFSHHEKASTPAESSEDENTDVVEGGYAPLYCNSSCLCELQELVYQA